MLKKLSGQDITCGQIDSLFLSNVLELHQLLLDVLENSWLQLSNYVFVASQEVQDDGDWIRLLPKNVALIVCCPKFSLHPGKLLIIHNPIAT